MKYVWVFGLFVAIGVGFYWVNLDQSEIPMVKLTPSAAGTSSAPGSAQPSGPNDFQPPVVERTFTPPDESQREALEYQEQEVLALASEYEEVRDDPESREQYRAEMQAKLQEYNEDVLPIALEKLESGKSEPAQ